MPDKRGHGGHGESAVGSRRKTRRDLLRLQPAHERVVAIHASGSSIRPPTHSRKASKSPTFFVLRLVPVFVGLVRALMFFAVGVVVGSHILSQTDTCRAIRRNKIRGKMKLLKAVH